MRKILFLSCFFFCQFLLAQNDSVLVSKPKLGVISVDKLNVVYRGIGNPISIAVPNAKSFTASGLGLKEDKGKYSIAPGEGTEMIVTLEIILEDDSKVVEEHVFRIKNFPKVLGRINNRNFPDCILLIKKEELLNAKISVYPEDFVFDIKLKVTNFSILLPNKKSIEVSGDSIDEDTFNQLKKFKKGSIFYIYRINYTANLPACFPSAGVIKVQITD
jgi:hypothetical protein